MTLLTALQPSERHALGDAVRSIAWSPTGRMMALGAHGRAQIGSDDQLTAPIGPDPIACCWITVDRVAVLDAALGVVVAGGGSVDLARLDGALSIATPAPNEESAIAAPSYALIGGGDGLSVVHPEPGRARHPTLIETGPVRSIAQLGGSIWVAGGADGLVVVDLALGCVDQRVAIPGVVALAASPVGGRVAAADSTGALHVLALSDFERGVELTGYPDAVRLLDISPAGDVVVACADDELTWWGVDAAGQVDDEPECSIGHDTLITACSFGAGGFVATGDLDGVVRLWSPRLRDLPLAALQLDDEITELSWSPWGEHLAIGTAGGEVVVANIEAGHLL